MMFSKISGHRLKSFPKSPAVTTYPVRLTRLIGQFLTVKATKKTLFSNGARLLTTKLSEKFLNIKDKERKGNTLWKNKPILKR